MKLYAAIVFAWLIFPFACVTFGVAIHGLWKLAADGWRAHKLGAGGTRGLLGASTRGLTHASPDVFPREWVLTRPYDRETDSAA